MKNNKETRMPKTFYNFPTIDFENIPLDNKEEAEPIPVEMLRTGNFKHNLYGEIAITKELMESIRNNFDAQVVGRDVSFDFNHQRKEATAWVEELDIEEVGDGNSKLVGYVSLTDIGADAVSKKRYQYFSIEFDEDWVDPEGNAHGPTLLGGALTNRPFITKLGKIEFEESDENTKLYKFVEEKSMTKEIKREPVIVDDDKNKNGDDNKVQFEEAVSFIEEMKKATGVNDVSGVKEFFASIKSGQNEMQKQIKTLQEENESLKDKSVKSEKRALVADVERKCEKLLSEGHHPSVVNVAKSIMLSEVANSGSITFEDTIGTGDDAKKVELKLNITESLERLLEAIPAQQRANYKQETLSGVHDDVSDEQKIASFEEGRKRAMAKRGFKVK